MKLFKTLASLSLIVTVALMKAPVIKAADDSPGLHGRFTISNLTIGDVDLVLSGNPKPARSTTPAVKQFMPSFAEISWPPVSGQSTLPQIIDIPSPSMGMPLYRDITFTPTSVQAGRYQWTIRLQESGECLPTPTILNKDIQLALQQ